MERRLLVVIGSSAPLSAALAAGAHAALIFDEIAIEFNGGLGFETPQVWRVSGVPEPSGILMLLGGAVGLSRLDRLRGRRDLEHVRTAQRVCTLELRP